MLEIVAAAGRHRNVYIDTSAHTIADMASPGSGWEPLLFAMRGPVRRRVLFGSLHWTQGRHPAEIAAEAAELPLSSDAIDAWLHDNACRLLRVDASFATATSA